MIWLSNHQLERLILHHADAATRRAFLGVFPITHLPKHVPHLPALMIVNTQAENLSGDRWLSLLRTENGDGNVFNSTGVPPHTKVT